MANKAIKFGSGRMTTPFERAVNGHYHSGVRLAGTPACYCDFYGTDGIPEKSIVKFKEVKDASETTARMLVLENRGPRTLVVNLDFLNNPDWPIPPTSVYATEELEIA